MPLSSTEALNRLGTSEYSTVESIINLIHGTSGEVVGATSESTYLLYSGKIPGGDTFSSEVVPSIKTAGGGVDIVDSQVGKLVLSPIFREELSKAITREVLQNGSDDFSSAN